MPYPTITTLPAAPQRASADPQFSNQVDAFLGAMPGLVTEINAAGDWIETEEGLIAAHKTAAEAAQTGAEAALDATAALASLQNYRGPWASGTTYAIGDSVKYDGYFWYSNIAGNLGNTPPGGAGQWEIFSVRGQLGVGVSKTDTASIATQTWSATGLEIQNMIITNGANPVLLMASICAYVSSGGLWFRFLRSGGPILLGDAAGSREPITGAMGVTETSVQLQTMTLLGIDTPGSSGMKNYEIQWRLGNNATNTSYLNRTFSDTDSADSPRAISTFRAVELL